MKTSYTLSLLFIVIITNLWILQQTELSSKKSVAPPLQPITKPESIKDASIVTKEDKAAEIVAPFKVL
ncbi:hypothetical protein [Flavobacterium phycosphaerae]|uniref:hypothetical protein n=1 Tax=Flavobacterium phycosphaerae TaxID=2697515 RepID=UPI00138948AB|nr:hypothetical protein [Flavobacterium phycosphaerae]